MAPGAGHWRSALLDAGDVGSAPHTLRPGWQILRGQVCRATLERRPSLRRPLPDARRSLQSWQLWSAVAALFAALTALLIKRGVQGVDAGMATSLRILAVAVVLAQLQSPSIGALALSGLATGVSWFC